MPWAIEYLHPSITQTRLLDPTYLLRFNSYTIEISQWQADLNIRFLANKNPGMGFWVQVVERSMARQRRDGPLLPLVTDLKSLDEFLKSCHQDLEVAFSSENIAKTISMNRIL
jgi:hypothetical protein